MHIAHVSDFTLPRLGGIEVHVASLAERQRAAGNRVDIVTALGGNGGGLARMRPSVLRDVVDAVRNGGYDVVHVHAGVFTPIAFAAAAAASRAGIPTVVTAHSLLGHHAQRSLRVLDRATGWSRLPIAWTAVSDPAAMPVRRLIALDAPVTVLPNAIDRDAWRVTPVDRDGDHVLIVAVNRLAARKRPLPLVRALRATRDVVPPSVRLSALVVGDGPQQGAVQRAIARHGMEDWVHLTGRLAHREIRTLYRRADVFVAPARLESFGIAALEARASGLPVVAMAGAGISTFIDHGREGLLAADDHGLVDAIATLATDHEQRARITAYNRAHRPPYGWADALDRTELEYARAEAIQVDALGTSARRRIVPVPAAEAIA